MKKGFTLVELAIVLVIVGLVVGGTLAGQELVKQAQIRSVLSTIREYDTAVNTYRVKYNAMLSDFDKIEALGINLDSNGANNFFVTDAGTSYNGNSNGDLESNNCACSAMYNGEIANSPIALSNLGLVQGDFSNLYASNDASLFTELASLIIPSANAAPGPSVKADINFKRLSVGGAMLILTANHKLEYLLGASISFPDNYLNNLLSGPIGNNLTPEEAFFIDNKLDDGKPNSGVTQATSHYNYNGASYFLPSDTGASACALTADTDSEYNVSNTDKLCTIHVRASY